MSTTISLRFLCFFAFLFISISASTQTVCSTETRQKLEAILVELSQKELSGKSQNELVQEIAPMFLNTPYVEKTLELPGTEKLVINLNGVDCTTYLETVVTIARIVEKGDFSFKAFEKELEKVRYRTGFNEGYSSRLHYFSDWIYENQRKGILEDITEEIGGERYPNRPTFMTENPKFYPQLSNKENVEQLQNIEASIAIRRYFYIPKEKISSRESLIQSGDIIAITTSITNLDMVHVGFAMEKNGRIHLMHASSKSMEVELSEIPLSDYLVGNKSQSGIMVVRLINP